MMPYLMAEPSLQPWCLTLIRHVHIRSLSIQESSLSVIWCHRSWEISVQIMAYCLTAPNDLLSKCCLNHQEDHRNTSQCISLEISSRCVVTWSNMLIIKIHYEICIFEMTVAIPKGAMSWWMYLSFSGHDWCGWSVPETSTEVCTV